MMYQNGENPKQDVWVVQQNDRQMALREKQEQIGNNIERKKLKELGDAFIQIQSIQTS